MKMTVSARVGLILAALAFVFLPMVLGGQWIKILISTGCFIIAASGVAFMYSRLGMVSLGQVALMGVGGWVMLRMNHAFHLPFEVNLAVAGAVTLMFGWLLAMPALRMRGLYLALITLMAAGGLEVIFSTFRFPNGGEGFWGVMPSVAAPFQRPLLATEDSDYLRYIIFWIVAAFLIIEMHMRTAPGRAWAMIRRSEAAAYSSGVNVVYYKAWAFGLAGFLAGISGGLLAGGLGLLDPATFRASESIMLFALMVVGGSRGWLGVIIAGILYRVVPALFNDWTIDADLALVIFGAALLHAIITAPNGLSGQLLDLIAKLSKRT
ncbi:branched-chain amino acid ABC transporter permease [Maribrevibacterium harenarium]|uniref:Branched-chain amino acid ABC transporter permease n=1 Tax=Maribrevibacterium harenarium TaxID=2589817 RepID=A0A501X4H6_9GAMM|nr:branched-chain amino acid ABC transporter permease [Maribrevibacterium harenarium]TPE55343.1 branched-chain amino acid ABC transporter permease [Maribrevibacterium harenarium]